MRPDDGRCACGLRIDADHTPETCDLRGGAVAIAGSRSGAHGRRLPIVGRPCDPGGPYSIPHCQFTSCRLHLSRHRFGFYISPAHLCAIRVADEVDAHGIKLSHEDLAALEGCSHQTIRRAEASGEAKVGAALTLGVEAIDYFGER